MNLKYKILWFEDSKTWYDSIIETIKSYIEDDLAFEFIDPTTKSSDEGFDDIALNEYDLILMDLNLNKIKGNELIKRIREREVYTDVIFYSSDGVEAVRGAVKDEGVDGVFCSERTSPGFINKFKNIVNATLKKIQDVNNMRGLTMAEVAEMDDLMECILHKYVESLSEKDRIAFIEERKMKVLDSFDKRRNTLEQLLDDTLFGNYDFGTYHKWRSVKDAVKSCGQQELVNVLKIYDSEIIIKRNNLAHVKECIKDGKRILIDKNENVYSDDVFKELRLNIIKHEKNLNKILKIAEPSGDNC